MKTIFCWAALAVLATTAPAAAQGIVDVTVGTNEVSATVSLPFGVGATLNIGFESVTGLTEESLGLSAELVNLLDPGFLGRLPAGTSVPLAFPVLIRVAPPPGSGLSFTGVAHVEVYTTLLTYTVGSPLRIFVAPLGGAFEDCTSAAAGGSARVGGDKPEFYSEYMILVDLRPVDQVIGSKLDLLEAALEEHGSSMPPAVLADLEDLLGDARSAYESSDPAGAVEDLQIFAQDVAQQSGVSIPDVWQAGGELVLADDHTLVRQGLVKLLEAGGSCRVVAEASDGVEAVERAVESRPQVAILDLSMPRLSGFEAVRRIHEALPATAILVLTRHDEDEYVAQAVRAGASGYLVKDSAATELLAAVEALGTGQGYFGPQAARALAEELRRPQGTAEDPYGSLTPREREVFHQVVEGLITKEVARRLGVSVKTADNHRNRAMDKLGVRNTAELVRYAAKKGLID